MDKRCTNQVKTKMVQCDSETMYINMKYLNTKVKNKKNLKL